MSVSCQTQVHHSLRRMASLARASGGAFSRPSYEAGRCSPSDCARRQVNPVNAQDASAFISLRSTKLVRRRACMESKEGLLDQLPSRASSVRVNGGGGEPEQEIAEAQKVEGYLNVFLRVPCADVIRALVILRPDGQDCKQDGEPGCRHRPR